MASRFVWGVTLVARPTDGYIASIHRIALGGGRLICGGATAIDRSRSHVDRRTLGRGAGQGHRESLGRRREYSSCGVPGRERPQAVATCGPGGIRVAGKPLGPQPVQGASQCHGGGEIDEAGRLAHETGADGAGRSGGSLYSIPTARLALSRR